MTAYVWAISGYVVVEESSRIDSVIRVEDFSTLRQLLGVTARVQKFITLLKFKVKADPQHRMKTMTAVDILNAERLWIRRSQLSLVQNDSFRMWQTQFGLLLGNFRKSRKTEYLAGLREIHSSGRIGAKDTVAKINFGDVLLIHDPAQPRAQWRIGKVEKLLQGSDGLVRCASLRVLRSGTTTILLNHPLQLLYPLEFGSTTDQTDQREPDQPTVIAKRSQATRAAAQVARLRMKEQLN
eukprot:Em0003g149a